MRKNGLLICLVTVLVLGLMGFGFAKWAQSVTITTDVNTGNLLFGVRNVSVTDPEGTADAVKGGDNVHQLDVGKIEGTDGLTERFILDDKTFYDSVTYTISNAYPDYMCGYEFEIANGGTVPIKVNEVTVDWEYDTLGSYYVVDNWSVYDKTDAIIDSGNSWDSLVECLTNKQIERNEVLKVKVTAYFADTEPSTMPQGASDTQTITIGAVQWNQ